MPRSAGPLCRSSSAEANLCDRAARATSEAGRHAILHGDKVAQSKRMLQPLKGESHVMSGALSKGQSASLLRSLAAEERSGNVVQRMSNLQACKWMHQMHIVFLVSAGQTGIHLLNWVYANTASCGHVTHHLLEQQH